MTGSICKDGKINAALETREPLELETSGDIDAFLFRLGSEAFSDWNVPEADEAFRKMVNVTF
jgi:hypothetical protein